MDEFHGAIALARADKGVFEFASARLLGQANSADVLVFGVK